MNIVLLNRFTLLALSQYKQMNTISLAQAFTPGFSESLPYDQALFMGFAHRLQAHGA